MDKVSSARQQLRSTTLDRWMQLSRRYIRALFGALLLALAGQVSAQNLVLNPSFETLGQANWTAISMGGTNWQDMGTSPPTTDGVNGLSNTLNTGSLILFQDIVLPAGGTYTFRVDVGCPFFGLGNVATDFCRLDITNTNAATLVLPTPGVDTLASTNGNVLQTIFTRDGTMGGIAQADSGLINITALAGQTVRIRLLVQASAMGVAVMQIDNVRLIQTAAAVPASVSSVPTLSQWAMIALSALLGWVAFVQMRRGG